jgi:hypothetical protein
MRREDYQPPTTPTDSPWRKFVVRCLRCGSPNVRVTIQHEDGDAFVVMICEACPERQEALRIS